MEYGGDDSPDGVDGGRLEIERPERGHDILVIGAVADRVDPGDASLAQVVVEGRFPFQLQPRRLLVGRTEQQLTKQPTPLVNQFSSLVSQPPSSLDSHHQLLTFQSRLQYCQSIYFFDWKTLEIDYIF